MGGPAADGDVRPLVRAKRWPERGGGVIDLPEHPARWRRRRICLAWRRRRTPDHGVVGPLRSDRTGGKITAPGHHAAAGSRASGVVQTRGTVDHPHKSAVAPNLALIIEIACGWRARSAGRSCASYLPPPLPRYRRCRSSCVFGVKDAPRRPPHRSSNPLCEQEMGQCSRTC